MAFPKDYFPDEYFTGSFFPGGGGGPDAAARPNALAGERRVRFLSKVDSKGPGMIQKHWSKYPYLWQSTRQDKPYDCDFLDFFGGGVGTLSAVEATLTNPAGVEVPIDAGEISIAGLAGVVMLKKDLLTAPTGTYAEWILDVFAHAEGTIADGHTQLILRVQY